MSAWRERRSGAEPAPDSVAHVVARTTLSLRATHAVESLLFLVAAALCVRAAAEWDRGAQDGRAVWGLALFAGTLAAAAWWREHPVSRARVARDLDHRLRHHGGLVTAFELEQRSGAVVSDMERLVSRRVLERLRLGEALRALLPPLLLPVAAPVGAALVLLVVLEARPPAPDSRFDRAGLVEGLEDSLAEAIELVRSAAEAGLISSEEARDALQRLSQSRRELVTQPERSLDDAAARQALDQQLEELETRARAVGPEGGFDSRAVTRARAWLDALAQETLARGTSEPRPDAGTRMEPAALAPGPGNGIMSGSSAGSSLPPSSSVMPPIPVPDAGAPSPVRPELGPELGSGAGGARWWPAAQNGLVEAWVERSRTAARDR